MSLYIRLLFLLVTLIQSCDNTTHDKGLPDCIKTKIAELKAQPVFNPPAEVWEWSVDGTVYYYFTSDCCDQFNYLYDKNCTLICAPDGGIAGTGDGNCPAFNSEVVKTLVWKDPRQ